MPDTGLVHRSYAMPGTDLACSVPRDARYHAWVFMYHPCDARARRSRGCMAAPSPRSRGSPTRCPVLT
eukprot:1720248-Rhodomonas_salina.1